MKQTGFAYACGAGTIINAISTWKGATFGIDLTTEAEVILTDDKKIKGYMMKAAIQSLSSAVLNLLFPALVLNQARKLPQKPRYQSPAA